MQPSPQISIITVVFNCEALIERTINSVLSQTDVHLEYIIIDGDSSDGTISIINKYKDQINTIVSENSMIESLPNMSLFQAGLTTGSNRTGSSELLTTVC